MSRDMRVSTLRQMPHETNSELLNRLLKDLLVIEYTGYPLEERRISHFIINALLDPNRRQNASIQYQHLRQSSTHSFDYWLNIIRALPTSTSTLPPGLHHANTSTSTSNPHRYRSPTSPKPPSPNHTHHTTSSYTSDSCSHCGRPGHNAQHCRHNPASTNYNDFPHNNKRHFPQEYRRSQSPNNHRPRSNLSRSHSPSRHPNFYSSSPNSTNKYQVRPQKHTNDTHYSSNSTRSNPPPSTNTSRVAPNNINKPKMMNANITRYESDNNEIFSENQHTSSSEDIMNLKLHNTSDITLNNSLSCGMPNFYNYFTQTNHYLLQNA